MNADERIQELERLLKEAQKRAATAEKGRQRAEEDRERAEEDRERAEEDRERAEEQVRGTTLDEYLTLCHTLVFSHFAVQTNKALTTQGTITNPQRKLCPTRLEPWHEFLDEQRRVLGAVQGAIQGAIQGATPAAHRPFESRHFVEGMGRRVSGRKVGSERGLEYILHVSVEDPVRIIAAHFASMPTMQEYFDMGHGVVFENHPHALSDVSEEVMENRTPPPPTTPRHVVLNRGQLRPDQICVFRYLDDEADETRRTMAYVIEYKAPHKLTPPHLRLGLRPMDILDEVVNRATIPTKADPEGLFAYHADRLATAAVTQTYHYMVEGGLDYGLMTTGEAMVFLKIDWARDPGVLYYHLAEPGPEVDAHASAGPYCTAVGQLLAFTLTALGPPGSRRGHTQDERDRAVAALPTWSVDYEALLRSIPLTERTAPPTSPAYRPRTYEAVDRSPYLLRRPKHPTPGDGDAILRRPPNRSPESSGDEQRGAEPPTPTPSRRRNVAGRGLSNRRRASSHRRGGSSSSGGSGGGGGAQQNRPFCTQSCLLGLVRQGRQGRLDEKCPNVSLHRRCGDGADHHAVNAGDRHPISHAEWLRLLSEQLKRTLDEGLTRMYKEGARGVLFRVTLLSHGYTCVAKGTVPEFVRALKHEEAVYDHLGRAPVVPDAQSVPGVQGLATPVFLGAIDLRDLGRTYYYAHRVRVVYLMMLSWAGDSIDYVLPRLLASGRTRADLEAEVIRSVAQVHARGVLHHDVRFANVLWCDETGRAVLIDFERATFASATGTLGATTTKTSPDRAPLAAVMPNKRKRSSESMARAGAGTEAETAADPKHEAKTNSEIDAVARRKLAERKDAWHRQMDMAAIHGLF